MLIQALLILLLGVGEVLIGAGAWLYAGPALGSLTLGLLFVTNYFLITAHVRRSQADKRYRAMRDANQARMDDLRRQQDKLHRP